MNEHIIAYESLPILFQAKKQLDEYQRCCDIDYFLSNYYFIYTVDGIKNFEMRDDTIGVIDKLRFNNVVEEYWHRRTGKSSTGLGMALHTALFETNKVSIVIGYKRDHYEHMRRNLLISYELVQKHLPVPKITKCDKTLIKFENGSIIKFCIAKDVRMIRGHSINFVYVDEYYFFHEMDKNELRYHLFPYFDERRKDRLLILSS